MAKITLSESLVYTDIDNTVCFMTKKKRGAIKVNYYGQTKWITPHKKHLSFLKSLSARGFYIIAHSGNGAVWAQEVMTKLGMDNYINEYKSKPLKFLDDNPVETWFGQRIYLEDREDSA